MKAIACLMMLSLTLLSAAAMSDVPGQINYQGTLTDPSGVALDDTVSLTFSLYAEPEGGIALWEELHTEVITTQGVFNVLLDSVNPLADEVFAEPNRWLGVRVETDPELTP